MQVDLDWNLVVLLIPFFYFLTPKFITPMSANQSNLSMPPFNYDLVVAVSEDYINKELAFYLYQDPYPELIQYWVYGKDGNPKVIKKAELLALTGGIDPLGVPELNLTNPTFKKIAPSRFAYALKAQIGIPPGYQPLDPEGTMLPSIVEFEEDNNHLIFNLLCSEFVIVRAKYDQSGMINNWINRQQHKGDAWIFSTKMPAQQIPISDSSNLPKAVQNATQKLSPGTYSLQKLFIALDKAVLYHTPSIKDVDAGSNLYKAIKTVFVDTYLKQLREKGIPPLSYSIVTDQNTRDEIVPSKVIVEASPYVGINGKPIENPTVAQKKAAALCYLSSVHGNSLPAPVPFNWNWFEPQTLTDKKNYMVIRKQIFLDYLKRSLIDINVGKKLCIIPEPNIHLHFNFDIFKPSSMAGGDLGLNWRPPKRGEPGAIPYSIVNKDGNKILALSYSSSGSDESHEHDIKLGSWNVNYSVDSSISLVDNLIKIDTHFVMGSDLRVLHFGHANGTWVDMVTTSTYAIYVDGSGRIVINQAKTETSKNNGSLGANWVVKFMQKLDHKITLAHIVQSFQQKAESLIENYNNDLQKALNGPSNFIFPNGKELAFTGVQFSDYLDLIASFSYQ